MSLPNSHGQIPCSTARCLVPMPAMACRFYPAVVRHCSWRPTGLVILPSWSGSLLILGGEVTTIRKGRRACFVMAQGSIGLIAMGDWIPSRVFRRTRRRPVLGPLKPMGLWWTGPILVSRAPAMAGWDGAKPACRAPVAWRVWWIWWSRSRSRFGSYTCWPPAVKIESSWAVRLSPIALSVVSRSFGHGWDRPSRRMPRLRFMAVIPGMVQRLNG